MTLQITHKLWSAGCWAVHWVWCRWVFGAWTPKCCHIPSWAAHLAFDSSGWAFDSAGAETICLLHLSTTYFLSSVRYKSIQAGNAMLSILTQRNGIAGRCSSTSELFAFSPYNMIYCVGGCEGVSVWERENVCIYLFLRTKCVNNLFDLFFLTFKVLNTVKSVLTLTDHVSNNGSFGSGINLCVCFISSTHVYLCLTELFATCCSYFILEKKQQNYILEKWQEEEIKQEIMLLVAFPKCGFY